MAGDYQGFRFTLIHNLRSLHTQNTVSLFLMKRTVFHFFHCRIFLKRTVFILFTMKNLWTNWNLISYETHWDEFFNYKYDLLKCNVELNRSLFSFDICIYILVVQCFCFIFVFKISNVFNVFCVYISYKFFSELLLNFYPHSIQNIHLSNSSSLPL